MTRRVLIVSPYFPPSQLAGVHRARHLAKHLPSAGWTPIVLCVDEAFHEQLLDPELGSLVPPSTEVLKVRALPASLTRPVGLGDITLRAWHALRASLLETLTARQVDVVLISAAPYYSLMLAPLIKRRFGIPVVLDFQDPWVSQWGAGQALWSKAGLSHRLATWLEPRALRAADFITSVSDVQNDEMAARYPWLRRERMAALPIGGDREDFAHLGRNKCRLHDGAIAQDRVNLSFVGTFMPRSGPLLRLVLRGLRCLRERAPAVGHKIRLNFIGTSNQPGDTASFRVRELAREIGVADGMHEVPQRLPFLQALGILARSDGILLIGSDEPHYTASKIYPAMMSGRPFLSLYHQSSSSHGILSAAGGGIVLSFADATNLEKLEVPIAEALRTLAIAPESVGKVDPAAYAAFEAQAIALQYAAIFEKLGSAS